MDDVAELERQLRHASYFAQASLERQGNLTGKLDVYLTSLIELLLAGGVIDAEAFGAAVNANRSDQTAEARARYDTDGTLPAWPTVMVRDDSAPEPDDEPPQPSEVEVDCAARMHICQAVCCSLPFPLSAAEVESGLIKWDLGHPYVIRQDEAGYCVHNDRTTHSCDVYDHRPSVCRGYSCAEDDRIWLDFDNMVLNEEYLGNRRRPGFRFGSVTADAVPVTIRPARRASLAAATAGPAS